MKSQHLLVYAILFLIGIYIIASTKTTIEHFNPYYDYNRAYPETFAFKPGYGQYYPPLNFGRNNRYNPGYSDYWYIPAHQYMNRWMNGSEERSFPNACVVPPSVSEYCVNTRVQETGDINEAILNCTIPASISESYVWDINQDNYI